MFGIKIISERKFFQMKNLIERHDKAQSEKDREIERINKDLESLRQQLNDKMKECRKLQQVNEELRKFKYDTLKVLDNIDLGSFRLKVCVSKCDTCEHEPSSCRKYSFGSHTFCVIPKQ